jgi:hypothetical protein
MAANEEIIFYPLGKINFLFALNGNQHIFQDSRLTAA